MPQIPFIEIQDRALDKGRTNVNSYERHTLNSKRLEKRLSRHPGRRLTAESELVLQLFERNPLGLRIEEEDNKELQHHHEREEDKGITARGCRHQREYARDGRIHEPMREATETLPFPSHCIGENLADIDPNDRSLGEREETDEAGQEPEQEVAMPLRQARQHTLQIQ